MTKYSAVFLNDMILTRSSNNAYEAAWAIFEMQEDGDYKLLRSGFAKSAQNAQNTAQSEMNQRTGRSNINSRNQWLRSTVWKFDSKHGRGAYEKKVQRRELRLHIEVVPVVTN